MKRQLQNAAAFAAIVLAAGVIMGQEHAPAGEAAPMGIEMVVLGEHSKVTARPADRDRIRTFYKDILGCKQTSSSDRFDSFQLGPVFNIGVLYDPSSPDSSEISKGIWLELRTDDPERLKARILQFGLQGIEYFDKKHFYFAAPGGQVFRIVKTGEQF